MITIAEYFMGRERDYPQELNDEIRKNAVETVARANYLLQAYSAATRDYSMRKVTSGWRPPAINKATPGAARKSKHMTAQAIDIADPLNNLDPWCFMHQEQLQAIGLWLEHPDSTRGWCHVQTVAPKSGNRVFYP